MIEEYSKVKVKSTGRVGVIVQFDERKKDPIHLLELTDTDDDARVIWVEGDDLEELPKDYFPPLED